MQDGKTQRSELFGRYRILGLIGQGGMARLHVAEQMGIEGFSKIVALKRVHPHLAASADLRRMFSTEAKLAAKLDHPNIIPVYELGEVEGTYFISMEYLAGEDLAAILDRLGSRAPMPLEIALWICAQAASALHYAHELVDADGQAIGMVHRDVTPSNIMVSYHGAVKLLDFGIAKSRASAVSTREGVFKGKLAYSAPEQLNGETIDRRADVFCLGIVLWECLTGRRLFHAPTDAERIDAVRSRAIPQPSSLRAEVPVELDAVVMRMLERDRELRYANASEVQQTLSGMLTWKLDRVTPEVAAAWLESTFGGARAAVKRAIGQGHNVEANAEELARMVVLEATRGERATSAVDELPPALPPALPSGSRAVPRTAWSTEMAGGSSLRPARSAAVEPWHQVSNPTLSNPAITSIPGLEVGGRAPSMLSDADLAEPGSRGWAVTLWSAAAIALIVASTVLWTEWTAGGEFASVGIETAALRLTSEPAGAQVFIDGAPTGSMTPATLGQLPVGRLIRVRVERRGMLPIDREIKLSSGAPQELHFVLVASSGRVRFQRVPSDAALFVDDRRVASSSPLDLSVGRHAVRVESSEDVLWSGNIDVRAGEQDVAIDVR